MLDNDNTSTTPDLVDFFDSGLGDRDPAVCAAIQQELGRQQNQIELIASENIVSRAVLEAQGGVMTNKYAEGYPGRRYYGGCEFVDVVEALAIERAKKLFDCQFVNVQPHSGAQANGAVMMALLQPGDTILGLSLAAGGHLTHGAKPAQSGKWFNAVHYGVREDTHLIDIDEVARLAEEHRPKLIICGGSAYPRTIDFEAFRKIADTVEAYLLCDMAHFAGLVATGVHPSPLPHAHVVTTTTHKTLRGPRGGMNLSNYEDLGMKFNSAVFPGLQGGPLMHVIAAKAICFAEAAKDSFREYQAQVIANASALAESLSGFGFHLVSGGSDNHLMLVDLRPSHPELTGKQAQIALEGANVTLNRNTVPGETRSPFQTSGLRIGTPAVTTRGMREKEMHEIGSIINQVIANPEDEGSVNEAKEKALALCANFGLPY